MSDILPTFDECAEIEAVDRTPLQAFIWENSCASEPADKFFRDQLRDVISSLVDDRADFLDKMKRCADEADNLRDVLRRKGFIECDIPACNCGSWHHRYGLPERWDEIKDALRDADVLDNSTGNMPLLAIQKLTTQRDKFEAALREVEATNTEHCEDCKMNVGYARRALAASSDGANDGN